MPDFTKLSGDELIAKLGGDSLAQSHLAWQAIGGSRDDENSRRSCEAAMPRERQAKSDARRIQALWASGSSRRSMAADALLEACSRIPNRNLRREAVARSTTHRYAARRMASTARMFKTSAVDDPDPEVRARSDSHAGTLGTIDSMPSSTPSIARAIRCLLAVRSRSRSPSLSRRRTHKRQKPIKVREAYDREFERYLVRMFLERHPDAVAKFLDSDAAKPLPVEARLLASLALEPKASAARVAKLLPQLQRAPGQEEVLRLAQFPDEPGVGEALRAMLANPTTQRRLARSAARRAARGSTPASSTPLLTETARALLASAEPAALDLGIRARRRLSTRRDRSRSRVPSWKKASRSRATSIQGEPVDRTI